MSTFRIQEFAKLAGVTVRTLHHYDRLGLLSPAHRSEAGYRLYEHADLGRLERVLVLRMLGLSLREIAAMLKHADAQEAEPFAVLLNRQHAVLRERRDGLARVLRAIEHAQAKADAEPEWLLYQTILKEINMEQTQHWMDKYYSPEGQEALRERRLEWTPELQAEVTGRWQAIYAEVQQAIDTNLPLDSPEAKALGKRWLELAYAFTNGNPELRHGLNKMYADRKNWPQDQVPEDMKRNSPKEEHTKWLSEVMRAQLMS